MTIGEVEETEAQGVKARYEYLLRLLKQRLLTLPSGMDIVAFLRLDGKPGDPAASASPEVTYAPLGVESGKAHGARAGRLSRCRPGLPEER